MDYYLELVFKKTMRSLSVPLEESQLEFILKSLSDNGDGKGMYNDENIRIWVSGMGSNFSKELQSTQKALE